MAGQEEDEVELARIIVDPGWRGRGVGRSLVELLVAEARTTGLSACFLRVASDNEPALRAYRSAGFTDVDADRSADWNVGQPTNFCWLEPTNFCWLERPDFG